MRRVMLFVLLALALPTAALASGIDFTTGLFQRGTITRTTTGGLTRPTFSVDVVGTVERMKLSTSDLSAGCNVAGTGSCTFNSGTLTVSNPVTGTVVFTDSLFDGTIDKTARGASIRASLVPNAMTGSLGGFVSFTVSFGDTRPFTNHLIGGTGVAASTTVIPEPSALLLFGTGLIGLAGIARRKLKDLDVSQDSTGNLLVK